MICSGLISGFSQSRFCLNLGGVRGKWLKGTGTSCNAISMRSSTESIKILGWLSSCLTWVSFLLGSSEVVGSLLSNFS
jgi:hypothetical protein